MASPPISKISFLDLTGTAIVSPTEWKSALIEVDAPLVDWHLVQLTIQDKSASVRIEHRFGRDRLLADWPRSSTGNYGLTLTIGDYSEKRGITIRPQKISEPAYAAMIDDLQRQLPTSIAVGLQKAGGLSGIHLIPPEQGTLAQELVRLRRAIIGVERTRPGLAVILCELAHNHHAVFQPHELWVDRRAVRRPSPTGLVRALVRSHNVDDTGELIQVVDRRTEHTVDVYENRLIKLFAQQVRDRLHAVLTEARRRQNGDLLQQSESLCERLDRARRLASFLDEVSLPAFLPLHLSMVLMRRDPYPAALESFLEFSRGIAVQLDDNALDSPLENLPSLYQTWGTLAVLDALIHTAVKAGFELRTQRLFERRKGELFIRLLPDGKPLAELIRREDGVRLRFIPEFTIDATGRYACESFPQRPDIVIEIDNGEASQLFIFDPKYKLDSELSAESDPWGRPKRKTSTRCTPIGTRSVMRRKTGSFRSLLYCTQAPPKILVGESQH